MPQRAEARAAVDHGGVFDVARNVLKEAHEYQRADGQVQHGVRQHQGGVAIEQIQAPHDLEQRHHQRYQRKHRHGDDCGEDQVAALEIEPRNRVGSQRADKQSQQHRQRGDDDAVEQVARQRLIAECRDVIGQYRILRPVGDGLGGEFNFVLERSEQNPYRWKKSVE